MGVYDSICKIAKQKKVSINSIEKETGLAIGSICKWNKVSPTVKSLKKVADYLGVKIEDLLKELPNEEEKGA